MTSNSFIIRPASTEDIPFLFDTWIKKMRESGFSRYVSGAIYTAEQHRLIERLLARSYTLVAASPDNTNHVQGYLCYGPEANIAHFAYVKELYRNQGVFSCLLSKAFNDKLPNPLMCTQAPDSFFRNTSTVRALHIQYNPYYLTSL